MQDHYTTNTVLREKPESKPQTSNLKPQTSNLKPQTSHLTPHTSNLTPPQQLDQDSNPACLFRREE